MSKEQVIDYVMTTPNNPNKAVLEGMLDSIAEAGGSTSEPLIVRTRPSEETTRGGSQLDKTFGEIRSAFMSGRLVLYVADEDANALWVTGLDNVSYGIGSDYASGGVTFSAGYSVALDNPPYTLEALDAEYPFISD